MKVRLPFWATAAAVLVAVVPAIASDAKPVQSGTYKGKVNNTLKPITVKVTRKKVRVTAGWAALCRSHATVSGKLKTKRIKRKGRRRQRFAGHASVNGTADDGRPVHMEYDIQLGRITKKRVKGALYVRVWVLGPGGATADECATDAMFDPTSGWSTFGGADYYVAHRQ